MKDTGEKSVKSHLIQVEKMAFKLETMLLFIYDLNIHGAETGDSIVFFSLEYSYINDILY